MFTLALLCELQNRLWKTNFIVLLLLSFQNTWLNRFLHGLVHNLWYFFSYIIFYFTLRKWGEHFPLNFKVYPVQCDVWQQQTSDNPIKCQFNMRELDLVQLIILVGTCPRHVKGSKTDPGIGQKQAWVQTLDRPSPLESRLGSRLDSKTGLTKALYVIIEKTIDLSIDFQQ